MPEANVFVEVEVTRPWRGTTKITTDPSDHVLRHGRFRHLLRYTIRRNAVSRSNCVSFSSIRQRAFEELDLYKEGPALSARCPHVVPYAHLAVLGLWMLFTPTTSAADFSRDIAPVLLSECLTCHSAEK